MTSAAVYLTPAQWRVLRDVASQPSIPAEWVNQRTLARLDKLGLVEDCPRMFYGPRAHRVRVTRAGMDLIHVRRAPRAPKDGARFACDECAIGRDCDRHDAPRTPRATKNTEG